MSSVGVKPGVTHRTLATPKWQFKRLGGPVASVEGFPYSNAMISHAEAISAWGLAELDVYLESPWRAVPSTISAFRGVRDRTDRVNLLAYLMTLTAD